MRTQRGNENACACYSPPPCGEGLGVRGGGGEVARGDNVFHSLATPTRSLHSPALPARGRAKGVRCLTLLIG